MSANQVILNQFAEHLAKGQLAPSTIHNYLADLRKLCRWLEPKKGEGCLAELTPEDIASYCRYLQEEEGRRPSTISRHLQSARRFCRFAGRRGAGVASAEGIRIQDTGAANPPRVLVLEEIEGLLAAARDSSPQARRDYAVVQVLVQTGLRVGEVAELNLSQVELSESQGILGLDDGRMVPLNSAVRGALWQYLRVRPGGPGVEHLFLTRNGGPLSKRSIQKLVADCARRAGLRGVSSRTLRATCAKHLLEETGDLELVSKLLGHARIETTSKYLLTGKGKDAAEALESYCLNILGQQVAQS